MVVASYLTLRCAQSPLRVRADKGIVLQRCGLGRLHRLEIFAVQISGQLGQTFLQFGIGRQAGKGTDVGPNLGILVQVGSVFAGVEKQVLQRVGDLESAIGERQGTRAGLDPGNVPGL